MKTDDKIFDNIVNALREEYSDDIYIIDQPLSQSLSKFPAVSVVSSDNSINTRYSTFNSIENVVNLEFYVEIYSNLSGDEKVEQTQDILNIIDEQFLIARYARTYSEQVTNLLDDTISRRVARYSKSNFI